MPQETIKVPYVAGWVRSVCTLVGNMLNEDSGFSPAGEVQAVWQMELGTGQSCEFGTSPGGGDTWREGSPAPVSKEVIGEAPPLLHYGDHVR